MARLREYEFVSVWTARGSVEDAYAALHDVPSYPAWWPEVKEVSAAGSHRFALRCRSLLPYDLRFSIEQTVTDPEAGVLEARMAGDLEGFSRWTITSSGDGLRLRFDEKVITNKRSLNALAPVARPAFKANHTLMMRHGQTGLRTFLAGVSLARRLDAST